MAEISSDELPPAVPGRQNPPRAPITDIKQWLEKFSLMAAVLASRFPEKAPELFAYQATIVRAERNYEGQQWVAYDRQFRREALAGKSLDWSIPNHRLYQEAFTGRARNIPRCSYCVQDDHTSELCTKNPARACFGWPAGFPVWPSVQPPTLPNQGWPQPSPELCRRFNSGRCFAVRCRYTHACTECGGGHPARDCPRARSAPPARARSPLRTPQRGFQPPGFHQPGRQMPSRPM